MSDGSLRESFNEDAERYDRARPRYPAQVFDDLAAAGAAPGARVLEIGCGTGQATVSLAELGYRIVAVELGAKMAAVARRNLPGPASVQVVTAAFDQRFDPSTPPDLHLESAQDIPKDDRELTSSPRFGPATFHRYEWELSYTTAEYLDLLLTYSGHRALPEAQQSALLKAIARLIDVHHGGRVVKRYLTELRLAERIQ